jgi:hypothetical protein
MNYKITHVLFGLSVALLPSFVLAQGYKPLVGIPGITDPGLQFGDYINALYALSISIAALLAVIKIVIAGMKYMLSDVVTSKSEAISDIQGSVFGLIIVISAVLILTVINPNLTKTEIFLDTVASTPNTPTAPPGAGITTESGYKYAKAGEIPTFRADCEAVAGSYYERKGVNDVCYDPLPTGAGSITEELDTIFNVIADGEGNLSYPAADRAAVLRRFQIAHVPRRLDPPPAFIATRTGASEVLLAVNVRQGSSADHVDSYNLSFMKTTCDDLRRATGKDVEFRNLFVDEFNSYELACIVD